MCTIAVRRHEFKACKDLDFCLRNRFLGRNKNFTLSYYIPENSVSSISGGVSFLIQTDLENKPFLKGQAVLFSNNAFQVSIEEISPLYPRYHTPKDDVFNFDNIIPLSNVTISSSSVVWNQDSYRYLLVFKPFSIRGYLKKKLILIVNEKSLMNFERYRARDTILPRGAFRLADATGLPVGVNHWESNWTQFTDKNPRGPSSLGIDITFIGAEDVYGIPEHADSLSLQDTINSDPYRLFNLDVFEFELNEKMALYGAIPFMLSKNVGFFWNNPSDTFVDILTGPSKTTQENSKHVHWFSETGILEFYLFIAETPLELVQTYTMFTGPPLFPPLFSLGYHQCRWNYINQEDLLQVNQGFENNDLPMDVIWLDIDHTPNRNYFIWNYQAFPRPLDMIADIVSHGRKIVNIVDPHLSTRQEYEIGQKFKKNGINYLGYYVKSEDGSDYHGNCWPGDSSWPDFVRADVRKFWAEQFLLTNYKDVTEDVWVWNDMNEPAVFEGSENTFPRTNLHGSNIENRDLHNIYGMYAHRATYEGLLLRNSNSRPFTLSRAFYAGTQRYGAIWTGDNMAKWEYMEASIPMCLSVSLGGISFCGSDVGGFFYDTTPELMMKWFQIGAYTPFFRGHANDLAHRKEPWLFGDIALNNIRRSLRERYRLLPYWYTLFYENVLKGIPVMRAMFLQYPSDELANKLDKQYHVGDCLLVVVLSTSQQQSVTVYLPQNKWYNFHTYKEMQTIGFIDFIVEENSVPVFIKGGSIIPTKEKPRRSTEYMKNDPYTLIIALDYEMTATGTLFVDDGKTFNYKKGEFLESVFLFKNNVLYYNIAHAWTAENAIEKIVIIGLIKEPLHIRIETSCLKEGIKFDSHDGYINIELSNVKINETWTMILEY